MQHKYSQQGNHSKVIKLKTREQGSDTN